MAYDLFQSVMSSETPKSDSLVNQSGGYDLFGRTNGAPMPAGPPPPKTPESWFGEASSSFGRGMDELESMGYGAGALASSWMGADSAKEWFMKGYNTNVSEAEKNPETVKSLGDIHGFDDAIRYGLSAVGGFAPMVFQSLATSAIGAAVGSTAEPGAGTIGGGVTGLVARKAVGKLLSSEVKDLIGEGVVKELSSYLEGSLAKSALSKPAQEILAKQGLATAKELGAEGLVGLSNMGIMQGALYGEMESNPDIPESDKRLAATVGGFLSSVGMTSVASTLAKPFMGHVTAEMLKNPEVQNAVAEKAGYVARFMTTGGKEMMKNFGHVGAAMFTQTAINIAAKRWADPNTRWEFLNYSPADWQSMLDSSVKGAVGGAVIGGFLGAAGKTPLDHPNPAVRSDIRDIRQMADDVAIEHPDVTPEHKELAKTQEAADTLLASINSGKLTPEEKQSATDQLNVHNSRLEELKKNLGFTEEESSEGGGSVQKQEGTEGQNEENLVNQKEEKPASPAANPDQAKVEDLRALYAQRMPSKEGESAGLDINREAVKSKQADIDTHIESVAGGTEYGKKLRESITPDIVNMMAAENVHLASDTNPDMAKRRGFAVDADKNGRILLYVPTADDPEAARSSKLGLHVAIAHEVPHIADFVNLRNEWSAGNQEKPLHDFLREKFSERGARMRQAEPLLPKTVFSAYRGGKMGDLSDMRLGQELPRMAVEMARNGQTSEVTDVLAKAAESNGKLNMFLRDWIDALKSVHGFIKKFLDPQNGNPELLKAFGDINGTLDKYKSLVNQKVPESVGINNDSATIEKNIADARMINPGNDKAAVDFLRKASSVKEKQGNMEAAKGYADAADALEKTLPPPPAPEPLPSMVAATPEVKPKNQYQIFRESIREEKGPTEVANKYLDWQSSKNNLPATKTQIDAAHIDLVSRHKGFTMSRERFHEIAKQRLKAESKARASAPEAQAGGSKLAAEKARIGDDESDQSAERDERLSGVSGGKTEYHTRIAKEVAKAANEAKRGGRLNAIRAHVAEKHPYISSHLENIVSQIQRNVVRATEFSQRWTAEPVAMRGHDVANDIRQFKHVLWLPNKVREASVELAKERGVAVAGPGMSIPEDHFIIDTQPSPEVVSDMINERASMHAPVEIQNKLDEARLVKGIPETYAITESFGTEDMSRELLQSFDDHFGENQWIVKSFSDDAAQSVGVATAEALKNYAETDHDSFAKTDVSQLMVQKLHPIDTEGRETNVKIQSGKELRVHVMTDMDGNVDVLPFSTFWKLTREEARVTPATKLTPIMVEDGDILHAHDIAREAVRSLPESDRTGQFYGLDIIRTNDGGWGVIELNPSEMKASSAFFQDSALAHESYLAALMGDRPVHAELASEVHRALTDDAMTSHESSLVNQRPAIDEDVSANIPRLSPSMEKRLDDLSEQKKSDFEGAYRDLSPARVRTKERGAKGDFLTSTPQDMEYNSQPQVEPIMQAKRVLDSHNIRDVIESLEADPLGVRFDLSAPDELDGAPNAALTALYQGTMQHIDSLIGTLQAEGKDRTIQLYLQNKFANLETNLRKYVTQLGRATSISGQVDKVINGYVARRSYAEPILGHLEKVLGAKGARFIRQMTDQLNELISNTSDKVASTAEVISHLQKIFKASKTRDFQQEARKTYVATEKRARQMVRSMANRAAAHMATQELGPEQVEMVAQRMIKRLSGMPVDDPREVESKIFNETVRQIVSEYGKDLGLIKEGEGKGVSVESRFAAILKNYDLYEHFTDELGRRMMDEYKPEQGSPFHGQIAEMMGWMRSRAWSEGMVESLVNKNMREFELRFGKIAQEKYGKTEESLNDIRESVRQTMAEKGVDNEGLLDQLMEDLEGSFRSRVEQARLDFYGSSTGVKDFLKNMQTNLANKAKEHASSARISNDQFRSWLSEDLGIPDTKEMPLASSLADVMQRQYSQMLGDKREEIVRNMVKSATEGKSPAAQAKAANSVDKILKLVNLGVFRDEHAYNALAEKFGLPKYREDIAKQVEEYGDLIATAPNLRIKHQAMQELSSLIASQKGIKPYDMFLSGLYVNYLSGISTSAVNIQSNAASLAGYFATAATQDLATNRGRNVPAMFRALVRSAIGSAQVEARESFFTGHTLHSSGEKFFVSNNVLEMDNPVFKSDFSLGTSAMNETARGVFERAAKLEHGLYRRLGGKWVGRALNAQDVFFYKIAQEVAFASKTGETETPEMRSSAMMQARQQMLQMGWEPEESRAMKRRQEIMANQIVNEWRLVNQKGGKDEAKTLAWLESHHEALDATFRQDPKGLLGKAAKMIEKWTQGDEHSPNPIGRLLIPFTRIAANVTNQMLEWTPYGLVRWGAGHTFGEDFRLHDETGTPVHRDPKVLIRSVLGTLGGMTLMSLFSKDADKDNPFFAVYDDGSKNPETRRQMMDAGWRPKTIKVGKGYYSYTGTPFSMVFSILGRVFDDFRDGKTSTPWDVGIASSAVAMLQAVTHESFLSSLTDFMSAVDSPSPEAKMSRLMSRSAVAPFVPNLAKQLDKWVNPTVQQADGFWESFIREIPYARTSLMPSLNIFGEEIHRDPGINVPGMERFLTMEKSDDPVYNFLGEKRVTVPGFSKSTKLGNVVMTRDQYYQYVKAAGPELKKAIMAELPLLNTMSKEAAQERVNKIALKVKQKARDAIRESMKSS